MDVHYLVYTTDPNRKRCTLHLWQEVVLLYDLSRREKRFLLAQYSQWETTTTHSEKSPYLELAVSSSGCFQYNSPFQVHKSVPLCFSGLAPGSPLDFLSQIAILCYSQVNPFCWRNIWRKIWSAVYILIICGIDDNHITFKIYSKSVITPLTRILSLLWSLPRTGSCIYQLF